MNLLFCGDIDAVVEAQVIARGTSLAADVLKVAHHGSLYGSSSAFLAAVGASEGVISAGADNPYGHPAANTILRLQEAGVKIWRTDLNGTVLVVSDGSGYSLSVERTPSGFRVFLPFVSHDSSNFSSTPIPGQVPGTEILILGK
jgi:beta-lactamase superfamily II metal-dependent hydrolase